MTANEKVDDLKAIASAWIGPKLHSFQEAWVHERGQVWNRGHRGGTAEIRATSRVTREHASHLLRGLWDELQPHLDRTHLSWDAESLRALTRMVDEVAAGAAETLLAPIQQITVRGGDAFLDAEQNALHELLDQQRVAASARLRIYVADRRRREILDALAEAEARAAAANLTDALLAVREAKREAEKLAPDEGRLKRLLEGVITAANATGAVRDLQTRLQEVAAWMLG